MLNSKTWSTAATVGKDVDILMSIVDAVLFLMHLLMLMTTLMKKSLKSTYFPLFIGFNDSDMSVLKAEFY